MQGKSSLFNTTFDPALIGDSTANSPEGLRKLALTYKSSAQGKVNIEKFHNTTKTAKKTVDPRFRRARVAPTCEIMTKSDTKVASPFHPVKQVPHSLPIVSSSVPSSPKRSPRKKNKCPTTRQRSQVMADAIKRFSGATIESANDDACVPDEKVVKDVEKPRSFRRMHSFVDKTNVKHEFKVTTDIATSAAILNSTEAEKEEEIVEKSLVDAETKYSDENDYVQNANRKFTSHLPSGDGTRTLDTYISPPIEIKADFDEVVSKSVLTIPFSRAPSDHHPCVCIRCARVFQNNKRPVKITTSFGENNIIRSLQKFQGPNVIEGSIWFMWCLYGLGCFFGLILVAGLAWIISNDVLWNWVYQPKEPPPKPTPIYDFMSSCGAAIIFSVNIVFNGFYNILMLPRNSVYGTIQEEAESSWQ